MSAVSPGEEKGGRGGTESNSRREEGARGKGKAVEVSRFLSYVIIF